jgi:hypothetical protein
LNIIPDIGERAFVCGQTGSGKTGGATWLLKHLPGFVIYDTKIDDKFLSLPNHRVAHSLADAHKIYRDKKDDWDYIILRPSVIESSDPNTLDAMLLHHYNYWRGTGAYIDEGTQFHSGPNAGPGLTSLLTRGRSRKQTTIVASQRPARLTRSAITEAQRFFMFRLTDKKDQDRLSDVVPGMDKLPMRAPKMPKYHFYYFDFDLDAPILFKPVPLDKEPEVPSNQIQQSGVAWI